MTMHTIHSVNDGKAQRPQEFSSLPSQRKEDALLATAISRILQIGVLCSALMIIAGLLFLLLQIGAAVPLHLQTFPHTPRQVWSGLLQLQPQAIIATGLLFLIATPVLRVVVSIFAFNHEHDRRYALIALILLGILLTSFMLGKGGA
ncbi:hypothetical protein KSF_055150 [Reticulibacter mediterranei]|uniref:DUF1634 domain-containing protein n=1 Tax=Reticulibacter mediterranei TaxID=2778369 RepID=A0A8J3N2G2_9CHLR|nr:DUF1634 domain-containing protein [Reticulibacter mediterranei]GHO95467.1 hypothetical protein KSF_055150 [Reticulibacter mediterranei]